MSIEQEIFITVKDALKNNSTLSNYVEEVFDGFKSQDDSFVGDNIKNYIIIEPLSASEEYPSGSENLPASYGIPKKLIMTIGIVGVVTAVGNKDYSYVTGYGKNKGVLDLDEDIKNALDNSATVRALSDAEEFNVTTNSFIFETFPKRKVILTLTIGRNFLKGAR